MTEIEKREFINEFPKYVSLTSSSDFLVKLVLDFDMYKIIIENNLFWKHIEIIATKYGADKSFEMFKILAMKDINKEMINEEMYTLFNFNYYNSNFYESLFNYIEYKKIIEENKFKDLLSNILSNKCDSINFEFLEHLLKSKYKDVLVNNFDKILNNSYNLLDLKKYIMKNKKLLDIYNNHVNKNPNNLIYEIIMKGFFIELDKVEKEKIFDTIKTIIYELLQNENLNYSDIEFLDYGALNYVISIGSKVLKLGQKRETFVMDNNRRFLKPILRTEINSITDYDVLGCIEVTEKVDTKNITVSDVYIVYKELRDKGYYWADCGKYNVGKLIRKNKIYFDDVNPVKEAINYTTDNNEELEEGELVILDNDYIFSEEEFNELNLETRQNYLENVEKYENKYMSEKRRK